MAIIKGTVTLGQALDKPRDLSIIGMRTNPKKFYCHKKLIETDLSIKSSLLGYPFVVTSIDFFSLQILEDLPKL